MALMIYNSLSRQKELFVPLEPKRIKMYVCGITVYDYCHIGHARSMIIFDVIVRYLRSRGFAVTYVRNITDIDDKIIQRAAEQGELWSSVTERFIRAMKEDEQALGILAPDLEPKATESLQATIDLVQHLLDNESAYVGSNGDVYFDVRRFKEYGKLSQRNIEELMTGVRVEVGEGKRDPLDFVLWKRAKAGEPIWPSPFGDGRPGWHIECSAMSTSLLGQPFDIHGGGLDLKFPHHENEIAQSEAAYHKPFAHYWMHAGLLQVNHEKMSKSLGNFFTIREILEKYPAEEIRYFMLFGHYRSPINYSEENLAQVHNSLVTLYSALRDLPLAEPAHDASFVQKFHTVMEDDFNFPEAFGVFFEMAHEINRLRTKQDLPAAAALAASLKALAEPFGLLQQEPNAFLCGDLGTDEAQAIDALIEQRLAARRAKEWSKADQLRDQLTAMGVVIEDHATGTHWRKK